MPPAPLAQRTGRTGVLLVGHGTRHEQGKADFLRLAELVAARLSVPLAPALLELAEPTIDQSVAKLAGAGVDRVVVAPLLLFAAGHAKQDVPQAVAEAATACGISAMPMHQSSHFGSHPHMLELARQRLFESIQGCGTVPAEKTLLVAVGRGSSDSVATAQMRDFGQRLADEAGLPRVQVAFLAVAKPLVTEVLPAVPDAGTSLVIVHPHLLFRGELLDDLTGQVVQMAAGRPRQKWMMSRVLADDLEERAELLVAAVVDWIERERHG
jgi:sirohydrochlorin cobaltochelatase